MSWDQVVFRGDPSAGRFIAFWLQDSRVAAAMNANIWDVGDSLRSLIRSRRQRDVAALGDADTRSRR